MKPPLSKVLEIIAMKEAASGLYKEIDARAAAMLKEYGEGRYDYEVNDPDKEPYLKFEIVDNIKELRDGSVWKSVAFNPVAFSSRYLKRKPESLK